MVDLATSGSDYADGAPMEAYGVVSEAVRLPRTEQHKLFDASVIDALAALHAHDLATGALYLDVIEQKFGRESRRMLERRILQTKPPRAPLRLLSLSELAARPVPRDLIDGVLPERGTAAIIGESGTGKSFWAHHMLFAVARGDTRLHGRRVRYAPCAIVQAEGSAALRSQAYCKHHEVNPDDLPIRIIERPLDLRSPDGDVDALLQAIEGVREQIGPVRVVLIDTLARTFGGGNENGPEDMGAFIKNVDRIARAIDGLVIVIHHAGKDTSKGARGHTSFRAALDAEIEVTRSADGTRTARVTKSRDGVDGIEFSFRLEVVDLGPHPDPEADPGARLTSCVCVPCAAPEPPKRTPRGKNQLRAFDAISAALTSGKTLLQAEAVRLVQTSCEMEYRRSWEAVNELLKGGFLTKGPMGPIEIARPQ